MGRLSKNLTKLTPRLSLFLLVCFLSSCSTKKLPQDTLFVILDSKPQTLDPRQATSANGMRLVNLIFNSFIKQGDQGGLDPDLALKWHLKGLTWIFYLKPDLKFSNGRELSKEDILFSFEEFKKKSSVFYSAFKNIKSVEVLTQTLDNKMLQNLQTRKKNEGQNVKPTGQEASSKKTLKTYEKSVSNDKAGGKTNSSRKNSKKSKKQFIVKITMKSFQAPFLYSDLPVIKILPKKEILESYEEFKKGPIGTGDFKVVKNTFREILLKRKTAAGERFPQYISFQIIRDSFTRAQKMLSKEMDMALSVIPLQKISQFKRRNKEFHVFSRPGLSTTYLLINLKNKLLKNKDLRRALSLSVHREEIIKYKLNSYAVPAKSFIPPENYFFNKTLPVPEFNKQKAKRIVEKLNFQGQQLVLSSSNNQDTVSKAKVLASQISQTGLKVSLQPHEWGAFYKDVGQGAFEIALMKWVGVTDPDIYRVAFHSENQAPQGRNRSFYENKYLDQLLDQGFKTKNQKKRKQIYDQIQSLIAKNFVVIPLWHDMEVSIAKANIKNYHLRHNGDFLSLPFVQKDTP